CSSGSHTRRLQIITFPEQQRYRRLLALLFSASYLSVLLGNALLVYVIHSVELLRSPVYQLTCVIDILAAGAVIPRMRLRLLFDRDEVSLAGCLTQMFFTHFLSSLESTLLLAMALDGYMAICKLLRSSYIVAALVGLAGSPCFCGSIPHCYCDHMVMVSLVGLAAIICFVGVDIPLILFSYIEMVERGLWSGSGQQGPLGDTHLMVMMCFYLAGGVTFLSHGQSFSTRDSFQLCEDVATRPPPPARLEDMRAPKLGAPWWLAAVKLISPSPTMLKLKSQINVSRDGFCHCHQLM
uniref:G-protein coupled receptors family 1 profile domain-containing protein n=1 Tax=Mola mola TaxID=94237 RepID=A0A3Q3WCS1_MOLML